MAIKINIKQNYLPFEIGDKEYRFDLSDKHVAKFGDFYDDYSEKIKGLDENDEKQTSDYLNESEALIKEAFDMMFGANAGDEIYALTGESAIIAIQVFMDVAVEIFKEIDLNNLDGLHITENKQKQNADKISQIKKYKNKKKRKK